MSGPPVSPPAAAAFFDLDKTIIAGSSALAFSRPFRRQGLITRRAALRSGYAQLLIMLSGADAATVEALRRRITALCTGWEIAQIRAIVAEATSTRSSNRTRLRRGHRAHRRAPGGRDEVVVLSASGLEVVEPIAALVGADRCQATRMAIRNGRYTGEIELYLYGERKAQAARDIAAARGTAWRTAGRTPTRSPTSRCSRRSGIPPQSTRIARCARVAEERGWPILTFAVPVALRPRIRPATAAAVAGAGLGAAALVGAGWYGLRRGHR